MDGSPGRARRALAVIALAAAAMLIAGAAYLGPRLGLPGGARPAPAPQLRFLLGSASFGDAEHGAVTMLEVGPDRPGPPRMYTSAWLTSDGGRSWRRLAAAQTAPIGVAFTSPTRALLLTADDVRSSGDAGRSWRSIAGPWPVSELAGMPDFVDADHGWALQVRAAPAAGEPPAVLWRTADGGSTWERAGGAGLPIDGQPGSLAFEDARHGAIVMTSPVPTDPPELLATADGGDTWRIVATLDDRAAGPTSRAAQVLAGPNRLVAESQWFAGPGGGAVQPVASAWHSFVTTSDDGGLTWTSPRTAPVVSAPSPRSAAVALDDRGRFVLLDGRTLWTSADGATWRARPAALPAGWLPAGPLTAAPGALFAVVARGGEAAPSRLLRSRDGGASWSTVTLPDSG